MQSGPVHFLFSQQNSDKLSALKYLNKRLFSFTSPIIPDTNINSYSQAHHSRMFCLPFQNRS